MCCCDGCDSASGKLLYVTEKLVSFCALTSVVCCIVVTIAVTLGVGIGLGYNYCFVDHKVKLVNDKNGDQHHSGLENSPESEEKYNITEHNYRRAPAKMPFKTESATESPGKIKKNVLTLPLHGNIDFISLLEKLRAHNKNVILNLVT